MAQSFKEKWNLFVDRVLHPHVEEVLRISLDAVAFSDEAKLKDGLESNPGVFRVHVNLFEGMVEIHFDGTRIHADELREALKRPDFRLPPTLRHKLTLFFREHGVVVKLFLALALMCVSFVMMQVADYRWNLNNLWFIAVNGLVVALGYPTFVRALLNLATRNRISVDTLITVVALSAMALGRWFDAAIVVFISLLAEAMETEATRRAHTGVYASLVVGTRRALVKRDGAIVETPVHEVREGDTVVVRQGMMIPVDGVVIEGRADVRMSPITGESQVYRTRDVGAHVFAGGMVESGAIEVSAEKVGKETVLSHIDRLIDQAVSSHTHVERLTDRMSALFLGGLIVAFLIVFVFVGQHNFWHFEIDSSLSLQRALAVMVALCPTAAILAVPLGMYAGIIRAAKRGSIVKNGESIEKLADISVVLFDKTGTLTHARPGVSEVKAFGDRTEEDIVRWAAAADQQSHHPMARAICDYATERGWTIPKATAFREVEGDGVIATIDGRTVKVGALRLVYENHDVPDEIFSWVMDTSGGGRSVALVADERGILGGLVFEDAVREEARSVVDRLRAIGVKRLVMVTGDSRAVAERVRRRLGLDEAIANCLPENKLDVLAAERRGGHAVAMVGDGINDAPVLAKADVGIAMGAGGSDAAIEAAHVALLGGDLRDLVPIFAEGRRTMRTIRWNIALAILGNFVMAIFAGGGLLDISGTAVLQMILVVLVSVTSLTLFFKRDASALPA